MRNIIATLVFICTFLAQLSCGGSGQDSSNDTSNSSKAQDPSIMAALGWNHLKNEEWQAAYDSFLAAIQGGYEEAEIYLVLAELCVEHLKQPDLVDGYLQNALKMDAAKERVAGIYWKLGMYWINEQKLDGAQVAFNNGLVLVPNDPSLLNARAYIYQSQKEWQLALTDYQALIIAGTSSPEIYYNKSLIEIELGLLDDALLSLLIYAKSLEEANRTETLAFLYELYESLIPSETNQAEGKKFTPKLFLDKGKEVLSLTQETKWLDAFVSVFIYIAYIYEEWELAYFYNEMYLEWYPDSEENLMMRDDISTQLK